MCCREVRFSSYLCMTKEIWGWPHFSADFPCLAKVRKTYPSGTMCRSRGVRQVVAEGYAKWKEAFRVRFVGLSRHIRIGCRCGTCHPRCRDRRRCSSGCCHVGGYPMSIRRWHRWSTRCAIQCMRCQSMAGGRRVLPTFSCMFFCFNVQR